MYYLAREQEGCRMSIIYSGPEGAALAETNEESEADGVSGVWIGALMLAERYGDGIRCGGARSGRCARVTKKKTQLQQSAEVRDWRPLLLNCGGAGVITQAGNWLLPKIVVRCEGVTDVTAKTELYYIFSGAEIFHQRKY